MQDITHKRIDAPIQHRPKVKVGQRLQHDKQAEIRLQKNGDKIEAITVVCSCGEEIEINCVYTN